MTEAVVPAIACSTVVSTTDFRPGEIHLWSIATDDDHGVAKSLNILDGDERARADRFRFERDRSRYVHSHAFTRRILGRYVNADPAAISIRIGRSGKPRLDPGSGISFSTSHDDGLTLVAVAPGVPVGVDVERLRPIPDALDIAHGLFGPQEIELLRSLSDEERSRVFLALWTRKESFAKAVGGGLSIPLDAFGMIAHPESGGGRVVGPQGPLPFAFASVDGLPKGYIGAVTAASGQVTVHQMDATQSIAHVVSLR